MVETYEGTVDSCDATDFEKRKGMFEMLHGGARTLFTWKDKYSRIFEDGVASLRSWYNSEDKQGLLLAEWQNMSQSMAM